MTIGRTAISMALSLGAVACVGNDKAHEPCNLETLRETARNGIGNPIDCGSFTTADVAEGLACAESSFRERSAFFVVLEGRLFSHSGRIDEPIIEIFCVDSRVPTAGLDAGRLECRDSADGGVVCDCCEPP